MTSRLAFQPSAKSTFFNPSSGPYQMHPVLLINELLSIIFEYAYEEDPADVAVLARTCRAFMEPALNELWACQLNLAPLIMCTPGDLWAGEPLEDGHARLDFLRQPIDSDWARFDFYARRIPEFDLYPFKQLSVPIFTALAQRQPCTPILPNLRRLEWW
ncbi:hypothetical protein JAAARDRAFT_193372 [Jaapia argillacea MUCL 33604]|uniref:F-box domain-containing protein n=1 Tax=Jaapia argillacea MUCL 33604 TaxID=933084 RepID=A0A067Q318_9AGAM|nr:hypothetical protein JAAARDRAFT_193372 [Jaapia argillacea MUCL 33604]